MVDAETAPAVEPESTHAEGHCAACARDIADVRSAVATLAEGVASGDEQEEEDSAALALAEILGEE